MTVELFVESKLLVEIYENSLAEMIGWYWDLIVSVPSNKYKV